MASFPVPVNNNLNQNVNQTPIAGVGAEGSLGGVRVDGSTIDVDPNTGVISIAGGGGGNIAGSGTAGFIPKFTAAHTIADSPLDDGITLPGTVTSNEPLAVYPVNPPGGLCVDIEVANITTPQTGEFDLVYITDSAPATTFETNVLLELDPAGTGTVGNQALHITNGLAAGSTNFAIKSDSPAKSVFAGEVQVPDLLLTPGSAPVALSNGQIWYDSVSNTIKARVNGVTITLSPSGSQLLAEYSANNTSTELDVITRNVNGSGALFQSDFDTYEIEFLNILPVTTGISLELQVHTGGSFDIGSNYIWASNYWLNNVAAQEGVDTSAPTTFIGLSGSTRKLSNSASLGGFCASFKIQNPLNTSGVKSFNGQGCYQDEVSGKYEGFTTYGIYSVAANAVDGIRALSTSGNLASGTIRVYGKAK